MAKGYLPYSVEQRLLLAPDLREWLPEGHLALFVLDVVFELDLTAIERVYTEKDNRGRAGYHPAMMVALLVYGYCIGITSSRRIERATYEDVAFRVLSGDQHPDHDCIADFRKQHLSALSGLFIQVLKLCEKAGLVKLGHIAIDGTKMGANASKHKAMSYGRMSEAEKKLEEEVKRLLEEAERIDAEEEGRYGKGKRGDELPEELKRRQTRLQKIREAKAALETEAKAKAEQEAEETKAKLRERTKKEAETGKKASGKPPVVQEPEEAKPDPKAQRNFTDPESRIMPDGAHKGAFVQGYNAQIAVDAEAQVIVAHAVVQAANDKRELLPMMKATEENVGGLSTALSADAGYFSEEAVGRAEAMNPETLVLVPPHRQKHGEPLAVRSERVATIDAEVLPTEPKTVAERMRERLASETGQVLYKMRKAIVEPVFGQLKAVRGLRRFSLRGLEQVRAEFSLMALTHNLLKLFRYQSKEALAA